MALLKTTLESLAIQTQDQLKASEKLDIRFGEETLTDLLLLELKRANIPSIHIFQTSKAKESIRGTDWEWWVGSAKVGWLRFAIQAKKLGPSTRRYDHLNHKVSGTRQIDLLKSYASATDSIALYCLFNRVETSEVPACWHCCEAQNGAQLSCTLASISTIEDALLSTARGRRNFTWIHGKQKSNQNSVPWRCLLCPTRGVPAVLTAQSATSGASGKGPLGLLGMDAIRHTELPPAIKRAMDRRSDRVTYIRSRAIPRKSIPRFIAVFDIKPD